jgi:hypothetical protein
MTDRNEIQPEDMSIESQHVWSSLRSKWYRLTSPADPPPGASFEQQEIVRRGRLTSIVLLVLIITLLALLPMGFFSPNVISTIAISGGLLISFIALFFNRLGRSNIAGLLSTSYVFTALVTVILHSPGGLSTETLGLFYTLVFVEVLAASLLPVNSVLFVAAINIVFVIVDLLLQPKTPGFAQVMATSSFTVITRVIVLHAFVVLVLWLWVRNAIQAIKRANSAEELAARERQIQELQQAKLQQREELEKGIELILQTHVQVSNGNFQVRAPLSQDNQLWQIAHSLNNFISRMQNYSQAEAELKHTREVVAHLINEVREAQKMQRPVQIFNTKTSLDPFLQALAKLPPNQTHFQIQSPTKEKDNTKSYKRVVPPPKPTGSSPQE